MNYERHIIIGEGIIESHRFGCLGYYVSMLYCFPKTLDSTGTAESFSFTFLESSLSIYEIPSLTAFSPSAKNADADHASSSPIISLSLPISAGSGPSSNAKPSSSSSSFTCWSSSSSSSSWLSFCFISLSLFISSSVSLSFCFKDLLLYKFIFRRISASASTSCMKSSSSISSISASFLADLARMLSATSTSRRCNLQILDLDALTSLVTTPPYSLRTTMTSGIFPSDRMSSASSSTN
mmetsp:Transcript_16303/g.23996  ORF Transcript_16303/g.23996 Transcript_16303/m.23996 type:complete len:238 (+) Transcript_16303:106-819(+)